MTVFCLDDKFFPCLGFVYFFVFYESQIVRFFCSLFGVFYDKSQIVQNMSMTDSGLVCSCFRVFFFFFFTLFFCLYHKFISEYYIMLYDIVLLIYLFFFLWGGGGGVNVCKIVL
jgi:hypothetical protein